MSIPTVDLSPFFTEGDDVGKQKAINSIREASEEYGFFQIANHGIPVDVIDRTLHLSTTFFDLPVEEKLKSGPLPAKSLPFPVGYQQQKPQSPDHNEFFVMFPPRLGLNVMPPNPPTLRETYEEIFMYFQKTGELLQNILSDCLGLPEDTLKQYNDGNKDFMVAWRYFPMTDEIDNGLLEHEDGNLFTFVIQDEVGGLQHRKKGNWIPIIPDPGLIVVNIGDTLQVLSNGKFKSATHRVLRPKEKNRQSFAFFYNTDNDKWIEPLEKFTKENGEAPKYRGFTFKEYQYMRMDNKLEPPAKPENAFNVAYYEIKN